MQFANEAPMDVLEEIGDSGYGVWLGHYSRETGWHVEVVERTGSGSVRTVVESHGDSAEAAILAAKLQLEDMDHGDTSG